MRRLALITTILLGASAVAQAQPYDHQNDRDRHDQRNDQRWNDRGARGYDRGYQGRRYDRRDRSRDANYGEQWRTLTAATPANGRQIITLAGEPLHRIRIQAVRGRPLIVRIAVEGMNGGRQILTPNQTLDARSDNSAIDFDIGGADGGVRRVTVVARPDRWSQYAVYVE